MPSAGAPPPAVQVGACNFRRRLPLVHRHLRFKLVPGHFHCRHHWISQPQSSQALFYNGSSLLSGLLQLGPLQLLSRVFAEFGAALLFFHTARIPSFIFAALFYTTGSYSVLFGGIMPPRQDPHCQRWATMTTAQPAAAVRPLRGLATGINLRRRFSPQSPASWTCLIPLFFTCRRALTRFST